MVPDRAIGVAADRQETGAAGHRVGTDAVVEDVELAHAVEQGQHDTTPAHDGFDVRDDRVEVERLAHSRTSANGSSDPSSAAVTARGCARSTGARRTVDGLATRERRPPGGPDQEGTSRPTAASWAPKKEPIAPAPATRIRSGDTKHDLAPGASRVDEPVGLRHPVEVEHTGDDRSEVARVDQPAISASRRPFESSTKVCTVIPSSAAFDSSGAPAIVTKVPPGATTP
ncbi:hypothetical protein GCM10009836_45130 [Pseudonocardia ailaonensis]|uniref:Uncharacterized protein n=1 Tax=Pseudonocardia ailaonensis TaxID=367279 RepID=A0ABN2NA53_9PSEU